VATIDILLLIKNLVKEKQQRLKAAAINATYSRSVQLPHAMKFVNERVKGRFLQGGIDCTVMRVFKVEVLLCFQPTFLLHFERKVYKVVVNTQPLASHFRSSASKFL